MLGRHLGVACGLVSLRVRSELPDVALLAMLLVVGILCLCPVDRWLHPVLALVPVAGGLVVLLLPVGSSA